jgi:dinuclear metal center YbgI/SA1388 family protein
MKLTDVLQVLDELTPLRYAESWDNVGLLVGDPAAEIRRVLVTVDYASELVAEEARAGEIDLVVAYHPPMFAAVKRVPHGALWADAVRRGIALYSMHTALDVADGGTNDVLADACGIAPGEGRKALRPFVSKVPDPAGIGLGRAGDLVSRTTLGDLVARLKPALALGHVLVAGDLEAPVERVAVAAGAGGELLPDAIRAKVDVFVTGEVRHHDAIAANLQRVAVVATLHSNSERAAVRAYRGRLAPRLPGVVVTSSERDADPFVVA